MRSKMIAVGVSKAARFIKAPSNRVALLFTAEASLFAIVNNAVGGNNYWFAKRLGANDFELSLVGSLPQLFGLVALLPGGAIADRLANKRGLVVAALFAVAALYGCLAVTPYFPSPFWAFLITLSVSAAPAAVYNATLTAYFADTVPVEKRNAIISFRSYFIYFIGVAVPLTTGLLLAGAKTTAGKIAIHRGFFVMAAVMLIAQTFVLRRIPSNAAAVKERKGHVLKDLGAVVKDKKFLAFLGCAMFFYMIWQADWTLWYIGQTRYIGLNEAWVSYATIGNTLAQLATIPFWTRINARKGFNFSLTFGAIGLALMPAVMAFSSALPSNVAPVAFLSLFTLVSTAHICVTISLVQELYNSAPKKHLGLAIAVYSMLVAASNAVMPIVGVGVYTALGATLSGFRLICAALFILRLAAALMWFMRYKRTRDRNRL